MRANNYVYVAATLAFSLVPPRLARVLIGATLAVTVAVLAWVSFEPSVLIGRIDTVAHSPDLRTKAVEVTPPRSEEILVKLPNGFPDDGLPIPGDLLLAFGRQAISEGSQPRDTGYFDAAHAGVIPIANVTARLTDLAPMRTLDRTSDWGIVAMAVALVLFAGLALKAGTAAIVGIVTTVAAFLILHINHYSAFLPFPVGLIEVATITLGLGGAAVGFKSTIRDRSGLFTRIPAVILSLPMVPLLAQSGLVPDVVTWMLPPIALFFPSMLPITAAVLILQAGLDLDFAAAWISMGAMIVLRGLVIQYRTRHAAGRRKGTLHGLEPDEHGNVDIDNLLGEN